MQPEIRHALNYELSRYYLYCVVNHETQVKNSYKMNIHVQQQIHAAFTLATRSS